MAPAPPSTQCSCDETVCSCDEPVPIVVKTPVKKKADPNTPTTAKRKPPVANTPKTPVTARKVPATATTPARRPQNARTPNSAPAQAKPAPGLKKGETLLFGIKKGEPTLFGDFLLGRPTPARQKAARRKSLDAVKAEMREGNMRTVQAPNKVQERVKQWQKNGAAAATCDPNIDVITVEYETDSEDEEERTREKSRGKPNPSKSPAPEQRTGRKTTRDVPQAKRDNDGAKDEGKERCKSVAPKKRVISDAHWVKNRKSPPRKPAGIPKNFLQATAMNPPVERKIEDWVRRTTEPIDHPEKVETPRRKPKRASREPSTEPPARKASASPYDDGIRVRGSRSASTDDGIRIKPSKDRPAEDSSWVTSSLGGSNDDGIRVKPIKPYDDGIRVKPTKPYDDGIRVKATKASYEDDGIRVRPLRDRSVQEDVQIKQDRRDGSKRRPREDDPSPTPTPRKKSETHLKVPAKSGTKARIPSLDTTTLDGQDDNTSWTSPTPSEKSQRKNRKSSAATATESLADIPFGNSAFSVLDLPMGAEANTLKRPPPKRNNSAFGVPRVLKKVYQEGLKIMQDNQEPARGGLNQPPSIDSWLKGTSDPFTDGNAPTESSLRVPDSRPSRQSSYTSRQPSYKDDDKTSRSSGENSRDQGTSPKPSTPKIVDKEEERTPTPAKVKEPLQTMEDLSPVSPSGLRRSPALHKTSSPKAGRKLFSKEALFDAFKGESAMARKKDAAPSPFDFIGLREQDANLSSRNDRVEDNFEDDAPKPHWKTSTASSDRRSSIDYSKNSPTSWPKRLAPTTGGNRLSTIASMDTLKRASSVTESEISQTTVTQDGHLNVPMPLSLSRSSGKPRRKRSSAKSIERSKTGSRRGLTKHSDLISMLSLPDTTQPGRSNSIRPARSVRTTRVHLETASAEDIMREIVEDETKYVRELNTLVDGVIPVLLTCVLSKSNVAIAAGLFSPLASSAPTDSFTKPIVDMGIALERLKSLHKRIPLAGPQAFLQWAQSAHKTYKDYLIAWRTGFQDVVVNLEPASPSTSPHKSDVEMARDKNGDVVRDNGERADVAYLLKRPLVRIKYLARAVKALNSIYGTKLTAEILAIYVELELFTRARAKEEAGRREDVDAAITDATRARDPKTMSPIEGVRVDPSLQVIAKDMFALDLQHSSGQRMECQVEIILRKSVDGQSGDILICAFDNAHRYLLFPPINKNRVSSRKGDSNEQLLIMIRGVNDRDDWHEILVLGTDDDEAIQFWITQLGTLPIVPELPSLPPAISLHTNTDITEPTKHIEAISTVSAVDDVPVGSRRHGSISPSGSRKVPQYRRRGPVANAYDRLGEHKLDAITEHNVIDFKVLNEVMVKEGFVALKKLKPRGTISPSKRATPSRYHKQGNSKDELTCIDITKDLSFMVEMCGALDPYPDEMDTTAENPRAGSPEYDLSMDLPYIPKKRASSASTISDYQDSIRQSIEPEEVHHQPDTDDAPPPVPAHRTSSAPSSMKNIPVIEISTPRTRNRRGSSPLKHEYQPSETDASGTSSCQDSDFSSGSDTSDSYSESSDDELEAIDEEEVSVLADLPGATFYEVKTSPPASLYSLEDASFAPSNSASQGPYQARIPSRAVSNSNTIDPLAFYTCKFVAAVSFWNENKAKWEDILASPETCSIQVGPGLVQAFEIDKSHSASRQYPDALAKVGPLVALGLTPHVTLRKSTMIDIEINSPPLDSSRLKTSRQTRYRTINERECEALYQALHRARMDNPLWKKLEQDRELAAYGNNKAYENAVAPSRRRWLFGRKKSYRAPVRASTENLSEQGEMSPPSALSALKRFGGGGLFNIAKSSVHDRRVGGSSPSSGPTSMYTTESSEYSGATSPRAASVANSGSLYSNGLAVRNIGSENLKVRLYKGATNSRWKDMGEALLTVSNPLPGMRASSNLYNGVPKRIVVVKAGTEEPEGEGAVGKKGKKKVVWLDVVLGSMNFTRCGRNGIAFQIWEDMRGDDGVVGGVPAVGGVAARTRKWMFQTQRAGDCIWIHGLVGGY